MPNIKASDSTQASMSKEDEAATPRIGNTNRKLEQEPYVYRDYSHLATEEDRDESAEVPRLTPQTPPSILRIQKLPVKLNVILSIPEFNHIISWMPHGRSWKVLQPKAFLEHVIPTYFEYSNYNSFVRLVNAWGFRRLSKGKDRNSYFHELFLRGVPHLHNKMKRLTAKEKKAPLRPEEEPDFYAISRVNPLPNSETPRALADTPRTSTVPNRTESPARMSRVAAEPEQTQQQHESCNQIHALSEAAHLVQRQQRQQELHQQVTQLNNLQQKMEELRASIASNERALGNVYNSPGTLAGVKVHQEVSQRPQNFLQKQSVASMAMLPGSVSSKPFPGSHSIQRAPSPLYGEASSSGKKDREILEKVQGMLQLMQGRLSQPQAPQTPQAPPPLSQHLISMLAQQQHRVAISSQSAHYDAGGVSLAATINSLSTGERRGAQTSQTQPGTQAAAALLDFLQKQQRQSLR